MNETGQELKSNNERIVHLINELRAQRQEINFLIERQELEKGKIENEIEKLTFKLTLLTKSLDQRIKARTNYDITINEVERHYTDLVAASGKLLYSLNEGVTNLEQIMDKKTGTQHQVNEKSPDDSRSSGSSTTDDSSQSTEIDPIEEIVALIPAGIYSDTITTTTNNNNNNNNNNHPHSSHISNNIKEKRHSKDDTIATLLNSLNASSSLPDKKSVSDYAIDEELLQLENRGNNMVNFPDSFDSGDEFDAVEIQIGPRERIDSDNPSHNSELKEEFAKTRQNTAEVDVYRHAYSTSHGGSIIESVEPQTSSALLRIDKTRKSLAATALRDATGKIIRRAKKHSPERSKDP